MSKELHSSQNNEAVGTKDYFKKLNSSTILSGVSKGREAIEYLETIAAACSRIHAIFSEVYDDLSQHIGIIKYIPESDLKNTTRIIMGLYDIASMVHSNTGRSDAIVSILSLSDSRTRPLSRASDKEIQNAVDIILKGGSVSMSSGDRMNLVEKAVQNGVKYVAGNDPKKLQYLDEVSQGKSREFLGDVALAAKYKSNPGKFTGRCGRVICSKEYIDHIEKHVFDKDLPDMYAGNNGDRKYREAVLKALNSIVGYIKNDLDRGVWNSLFITDENAKRLKDALDSLGKCGINSISGLKDKVDKLNKLGAHNGIVEMHAVSIGGGEIYVSYRKGGFVSLSLERGDALHLLNQRPNKAYEMVKTIRCDYGYYFNDSINLSDDAMAIEIVGHAIPEKIAKSYRESGLSIPGVEQLLSWSSPHTNVIDMGRGTGLRNTAEQLLWDTLDKINFWK